MSGEEPQPVLVHAVGRDAGTGMRGVDVRSWSGGEDGTDGSQREGRGQMIMMKQAGGGRLGG